MKRNHLSKQPVSPFSAIRSRRWIVGEHCFGGSVIFAKNVINFFDAYIAER